MHMPVFHGRVIGKVYDGACPGTGAGERIRRKTDLPVAVESRDHIAQDGIALDALLPHKRHDAKPIIRLLQADRIDGVR